MRILHKEEHTGRSDEISGFMGWYRRRAVGALLFFLLLGAGCSSVNIWENIKDGISSAGPAGEKVKVILDFDNGVSGDNQTDYYSIGDTIDLPTSPAHPKKYFVTVTALFRGTSAPTEYTFGGWYDAAANETYTDSITVDHDITLRAVWNDPNLIQGAAGNEKIAKAVDYVNTNAGEYILIVTEDLICPTQTLKATGTGLTIQGDTQERTIRLLAQGSLFTVGEQGAANISLTLGGNITLQGIANNTAALVSVRNGAQFIMQPNSKITGNTNLTSGTGAMKGGAVHLDEAVFTMYGGEISGNTAGEGGGVHVAVFGTMNMDGGTIKGNTAVYGGGVYVSSQAELTKPTGAGAIYGSSTAAAGSPESSESNTANGGQPGYGHALYVALGGIFNGATITSVNDAAHDTTL